jgi:hypothetical protein
MGSLTAIESLFNGIRWALYWRRGIHPPKMFKNAAKNNALYNMRSTTG